MNIAICDDSRFNTVPLEEALKELALESGVEISMDIFKSYSHLGAAIKDKKYDLLFLQVNLRGVNGIDFARGLRQQHNDVDVIFLSENADSALAAYSAFPIGYILLPPAKKRLRAPFRHAAEKQRGRTSLVLAEPNGTKTSVFIDDIIYLEVIGAELSVYTRTGAVKCYGTSLTEVCECLPAERFYRCHRSFVVNLDHVVQSSKYYFLMENGEKATIAKNRYAEAKEILLDYKGKRI